MRSAGDSQYFTDCPVQGMFCIDADQCQSGGVVPFVGLQLVGITLLWFAPGLATSLPERLFADTATGMAEIAPATGPTRDAGSPVADDFSDLFDAPMPGRNPPYRDNFDDLLE